MSDVIKLLTAPAGSGKSYSLVRELVDNWLPEQQGDYWTNLPIFPEVIADHLEAKGHDREKVLSRIKLIGPDVTDSWRDGESGPWDFFAEKGLQGALVVLDEAHEYCSKKHSRPSKKKWQQFLGQIRHRGCQLVMVSQHQDKLATELEREAGVSVLLSNADTTRDPFFKILQADWYELRAGLLGGGWKPCYFEIEHREVVGKWKETERRRYHIDPEYFQFYDSFSLPEQGGVKASAPLREFEKRSKRGLVGWFLRRNWWRLGRSFAILAALVSLPVSLPWGIRTGIAAMSVQVGGGGSAGAERSTASTAPAHSPLPSPAGSDRMGSGAGRPEAKVREEVAELRERLAIAEAEARKASELVAITDREAVFLGAGRVGVGEEIETGVYRGKKLESINWARRAIVLDDGRVLRLGSGYVLPEWQTADAYTAGSVPRPVQQHRGFGEDRTPSEPSWEASDAVLQRDDNAGVFAPAGGSVPGEHRMGRKLR